MKRTTLLLTAVVLASYACGSDRGGQTSAGARDNVLDDLSVSPNVSATEYTTSLHFLVFEPTRTRSLIMQFANRATANSLDLRYQAWRLDGSTWRRILDVETEDGPIRAPWRLIPTDSMRFTVNADGDPDDLILQSGSSEYMLDLGRHLDAWEDRMGTWHEIREATLEERGQRVDGISVGHRFAIPDPERPAVFGDYTRVILRSEDGAIIVLFHTSNPDVYGDPFAWMYADGLTRRWTVLETRTVEVANSTQLRRNVPIRLWFRIPEPDIRCELTAAERQFNEFSTEGGPKPYNALYRVRGWIEFSGERLNVEGLLERGET